MPKPKCALEKCFANKGGVCVALADNKFRNNKVCPFYKRESETMSFEQRQEACKRYAK